MAREIDVQCEPEKVRAFLASPVGRCLPRVEHLCTLEQEVDELRRQVSEGDTAACLANAGGDLAADMLQQACAQSAKPVLLYNAILAASSAWREQDVEFVKKVVAECVDTLPESDSPLRLAAIVLGVHQQVDAGKLLAACAVRAGTSTIDDGMRMLNLGRNSVVFSSRLPDDDLRRAVLEVGLLEESSGLRLCESLDQGSRLWTYAFGQWLSREDPCENDELRESTIEFSFTFRGESAGVDVRATSDTPFVRLALRYALRRTKGRWSVVGVGRGNYGFLSEKRQRIRHASICAL